MMNEQRESITWNYALKSERLRLITIDKKHARLARRSWKITFSSSCSLKFHPHILSITAVYGAKREKNFWWRVCKLSLSLIDDSHRKDTILEASSITLEIMLDGLGVILNLVARRKSLEATWTLVFLLTSISSLPAPLLHLRRRRGNLTQISWRWNNFKSSSGDDFPTNFPQNVGFEFHYSRAPKWILHRLLATPKLITSRIEHKYLLIDFASLFRSRCISPALQFSVCTPTFSSPILIFEIETFM